MLWKYTPIQHIMFTYNVSALQLLLYCLLFSVCITLVFYVYLMYIVHWIDRLLGGDNNNDTPTGNEDANSDGEQREETKKKGKRGKKE